MKKAIRPRTPLPELSSKTRKPRSSFENQFNEILSDPRCKTLADKFYLSIVGVVEKFADRPEAAYTVFARILFANLIFNDRADVPLFSLIPDGSDTPLDIESILREWDLAKDKAPGS
jgi:hypothetical protein